MSDLRYEILPPVKRFVEAPAFRAGQDGDWFPTGEPSPSQQTSRRHLARLLMMFSLGAAATFIWQSYGHAARETIARLSPQLQWLAPQAADALTSRVDQIAASQEQITRSVDKMAASQEEVTRGVDRIAAGQEQMTREITKLQEIEQYVLYKRSESPPPQAAPAPARNRAPRPPSQAPTTPTPATNP